MNKLPENWSQGALGQFFETITGSTPSKSNNKYYGGGIPFVKPPDLLNNYIHGASDNLSEEGASVARILPPGSILISCIGNLGKIAVNSIPVACNQQINAIKPNDKAIPAFMFYQVLSPEFNERLHSLASGTTIPIVNKSKFNSISVCIPPISEQKRIVAILDEAFAGISLAVTNTEKNLANARELFESYLNNLFTQKDDDREITELGNIIDVLTDYHANGSYKILKQHVELKETEDFAWMVRSTDFEKNFKNDKRYISESAYSYLKKSQLFGGEIIMSKIGNAGKVYFMPSTGRPCSLAMNLFLIRLNGERVSNEYVYRYLNSKSGKAQIAPMLNGAATQTITKDSVRSILIPLPAKDIQIKILRELELLEEKTGLLESIYQQKLTALNELKQSILQKAFSGQLTRDSDNG